MQICAKGLGGVQQRNHYTALNALECIADMNERGRQRTGGLRDGVEDGLLCPKPRRVAYGVYSAGDVVKPARRLRSHTSLSGEGDAGGEILDILLRKGDSGSPSGSISYFCGSPPSRASNPLIHDIQFIQRRVPSLPLTLPCNSVRGSSFGSNPSCKKSSCSSSYGANPSVRVEGFASSGSDSHRGVSALA